MKEALPTISTHQKEIILGSLLGDGGFYKPIKPTYNTYFKILRATHDKTYLEWQFNALKNLCCQVCLKDYSVFDKRTQKTYYQSFFYTRADKQFTEMRSLWYDQTTKIVPKNIQLTDLTIAVWFCDDGNFWWSPTSRTIFCTISTDCFSEQEANYLCDLLNSYFEDASMFRVRPHGKGFILRSFRAQSALKLFKRIKNQVIAMGMERKLIRIYDYENHHMAH